MDYFLFVLGTLNSLSNYRNAYINISNVYFGNKEKVAFKIIDFHHLSKLQFFNAFSHEMNLKSECVIQPPTVSKTKCNSILCIIKLSDDIINSANLSKI